MSLHNAHTKGAEGAPSAADRILAFVSQFVSLKDSDRKLIQELTRIERYPKGTILLAEGAVASESWLVIEGCVRVFRRVRGGERTVALHTELEAAIPPTYGTNAPSPVVFECLEDLVASASTPEEEARAFANHPSFESVCRVVGDALMAEMRKSQVDTLTRTAEERYLDLVAHRPNLLQRVPQYYIASYLGIQPETLSRIRRRLTRRGAAGR